MRLKYIIPMLMITLLTSDSQAMQVVKHYHTYPATECGSEKNINDCRVTGNNNTFRDINCGNSIEKKNPELTNSEENPMITKEVGASTLLDSIAGGFLEAISQGEKAFVKLFDFFVSVWH